MEWIALNHHEHNLNLISPSLSALYKLFCMLDGQTWTRSIIIMILFLRFRLTNGQLHRHTAMRVTD